MERLVPVLRIAQCRKRTKRPNGCERSLRDPFEFGHSTGCVSDKPSADDEESESESEIGRNRQCRTYADKRSESNEPRTESGPSLITPPLTSCVRRVLTGDSECNKETAPPHEPCDGCEGNITDEPIETTTDDYYNENTSKPV